MSSARERDAADLPEVPANPPPFTPFGRTESERIYSSAWCGLRRDMVVLPDGSPQEYHIIEISDAVVVVPVLPDGSIVMVGQYRYPNGKTHWEVPAGRMDEGEEPAQSARREMLEETGYEPGEVVALPGFYPTNGISAHFAHAFLGLDCRCTGPPQPDASEQILVKVFRPEEVEALLRAGRIEDGFSAISLLYYLQFHRKS